MNYTFPLVATHRDGETRMFYDAATFRAFAFDRSNRVGAYWLEGYFDWKHEKLSRMSSADWLRYMRGSENLWIVRDDRGQPVDKRHFQIQHPSYRYRWTEEKQRAAEQGLPIPHTGKRRWHRKSSTHHGRNGAHNQRKGIRLYEDPLITAHHFDDM